MNSLKRVSFVSSIFCLFVGFIIIILITIYSIANNQIKSDHKIIKTLNGKVRGIRQTTLIKKIDFFSFKGIPYAKSPTGELRFKPPEPVESWSPAIRDAFEHGPICLQLGLGDLSEDCLFLNIYVPADVKPDERLPVLVFIHGGGYGIGSGNDDVYGPDFLIDQRIILVTMNYRLGVLGFMSFGTPEYSGNMGLKDQQLALKWIHSNIEHFSGDNQRITLGGVSAGGASTHFHVFSTESRQYFRNIICMSGTVDDYWALSKGSDHLDFARKITQEVGEPKQSADDLIAFFKTVPADKLKVYGNLFGFFQRTSQAPLAPVIEIKNASRPFIVDLPSKIYEQSNMDINALFGFCETEFISFYTKKSPELNNFTDLNGNFSLTLPFRAANLSFDSPEYQKIANEIRHFYFKDEPIDERALMRFLELLSDVNFAYGIDKSARVHANKSNAKTFYYRFSVDSKLNVVKGLFGDGGSLPSSGHGDDLCYLFRCSVRDDIYEELLENKGSEQSTMDLQIIEYLSKLVSNFVKYGEPSHDGDPVVGFKPIQGNKMNFLDIANDGLKLGVNPNREANELWANIERQIDEIITKL